MALARLVYALRRAARDAVGLSVASLVVLATVGGPRPTLPVLAAVAAAWALAVAHALGRLRRDPTGTLPGLELGALALAAAGALAAAPGAPPAVGYLPLLVATLAGALAPGHAAPLLVALAAGLGQLAHARAGHGGLAPDAVAALVFGGLAATFARIEIARIRAASRLELAADKDRAREDARLYRLVSGTESGGLASPREDERLLRASVDEARHGLFHTLDLVHRALGLHGAVLLLLDAGGTRLRIAEAVVAGDGLRPGPFAAGDGLYGAVALRGRTVRLERLRPDYRGLPHYEGPSPARSVLGLPMYEGAALRGALIVDRADDRPFEAREEELLERALVQLRRVLDNERVFVQLERSKREQAMLHRASQALGAALDEADVIEAAASAAREIADYGLLVVTRWDRDRRRHVVRHARGEGADALADLAFADGPSLVSMVVRNRHHLPYRGDFDGAQQTLFTRRTQPAGARSALVLPLVARDDVLGTLVLVSRKRHAYREGVRTTLEALAHQVAVALANAAAVARLEALATTDGLTGCLNKRALLEAFEAEMKAAARFERPLSLLVTDIDHFKRVNDTHGHATGDRVLAELGALLRRVKRDTDVVGRFGGEEFCVVCQQTDTEGARLLAERVREQLAGLSFVTPQGPLKVTCSVGVATFPAHGADVTELFEAADRALYVAKRQGRNQVVISPPLARSRRAG